MSPTVWAMGTFAVLTTGAVWTARWQEARGRLSEGPALARVVVAFTGETLAQMAPCGCNEGQLGGLARRNAAVRFFCDEATAAGKGFVLVDLGDLVKQPGAAAQIQMATIREAFARSGTQAVANGEADWLANVGPKDGTLQWIIPAQAGVNTVSVGVLALVSPSLAGLAGMTVRDPAAMAGAVMAGWGGRATIRILLWHGDRSQVDEMGAALKEFHLVVAGHGRDLPEAHARPDGPVVANLALRGSYLGLAEVEVRPGGARVLSTRFVPLGPRIPNDPETVALLSRYRERLRAAGVLAQEEQVRPTGGGAYVGSAACASCHAEADAMWRASRHAHAFRTLVTAGSDADPDCVRCHVTGFGWTSGFVDPAATPHLTDVGCEACHGPGSVHQADPQPGYGRTEGPATCQACHTALNSPKFVHADYWERIRH